MTKLRQPEVISETVVVPSDMIVIELVGPHDARLRHIQSLSQAAVHLRGNRFTVTGGFNEVMASVAALRELITLVERGTELDDHLITQTFEMLHDGTAKSPSEILGSSMLSHRGKAIKARTLGQKVYLDAIKNNTVTFGFGPAGTGKTYLAMAMAVVALKNKQVSRIILTRPAVEAGESLGFLPGTLHEKIDPYLRPLFDALHDMMEPEVLAELMEKGVIEVAPLAYMRGRTLNDAFVVLDEAQNTTNEQMKMFLTRIGFGSKVVVTGDRTQVDLPGDQKSSLGIIRETLDGIEGLTFIELTAKDVVRHKIVQDIVNAYERADVEREKKRSARKQAEREEKLRRMQQRNADRKRTKIYKDKSNE